MTARALRAPRPGPDLSVLTGSGHRRNVFPFVAFSLVAILAFLGTVFTRTSLDRTAIELSTLSQQVAEAKSLNQRLRLEIARLESPARVAPLAHDLGMVYPQATNRLVVEGVIRPTLADPRWSDLAGLAAAAIPPPAATAEEP
jgi:cell division protein FtsL